MKTSCLISLYEDNSGINEMFLIVGRNDVPIYAENLGTSRLPNAGSFCELAIHAALDIVDERSLLTTHMYFPKIDTFEEVGQVSAYVTASNMRLMLVHESRSEDAIKNFFYEIHEALIKVMLNPFFDLGQTCKSFDAKVKQIAKRYLV
mmetsp:Transcript_1918/g.4249  ORF Transcript_1918/g.4249 Transcript_1918/m.4249 type:complete len:148 (+) Transcript_1918:804-1247(+)